MGHEFQHRAGNGPSLGPWQVTSLLEAFGTSNAAPVGQDLWMRVEVEGWGQPGFSLVSGWLRNSWGYVDRFYMCRGFGEKTEGSRGELAFPPFGGGRCLDAGWGSRAGSAGPQ